MSKDHLPFCVCLCMHAWTAWVRGYQPKDKGCLQPEFIEAKVESSVIYLTPGIDRLVTRGAGRYLSYPLCWDYFVYRTCPRVHYLKHSCVTNESWVCSKLACLLALSLITSKARHKFYCMMCYALTTYGMADIFPCPNSTLRAKADQKSYIFTL